VERPHQQKTASYLYKDSVRMERPQKMRDVLPEDEFGEF